MGFKERIDRIEKKEGYILVWVNSTGWPLQNEKDIDDFCTHMDTYHSICSFGPLSREKYEELCKKHGIKSIPDDNLGDYGDIYGDFGMSHYHTKPKNRITGLTHTLSQARWHGMGIEDPDIESKRAKKKRIEAENKRLKELRKTYPKDLQKWIKDIGGLEEIYQSCVKIHDNNTRQLNEEGRHFEWLIGHACRNVGRSASINHPKFIKPETIYDKGYYPLSPEWWAEYDEVDPEHPINKIAEMLKDRRIGDSKPSSILGKKGQIWQECECGNIPVYLPLLKCDKCWPK